MRTKQIARSKANKSGSAIAVERIMRKEEEQKNEGKKKWQHEAKDWANSLFEILKAKKYEYIVCEPDWHKSLTEVDTHFPIYTATHCKKWNYVGMRLARLRQRQRAYECTCITRLTCVRLFRCIKSVWPCFCKRGRFLSLSGALQVWTWRKTCSHMCVLGINQRISAVMPFLK